MFWKLRYRWKIALAESYGEFVDELLDQMAEAQDDDEIDRIAEKMRLCLDKEERLKASARKLEIRKERHGKWQ